MSKQYRCVRKCYHRARIWTPGEILAPIGDEVVPKHFEEYKKIKVEVEVSEEEARTLREIQEKEAQELLGQNPLESQHETGQGPVSAADLVIDSAVEANKVNPGQEGSAQGFLS